MPGKAPPMRPVCRAAIGGLFAIWLAPLAAALPACGAECRCAETRPAPPQAEPAADGTVRAPT
jgi:hypothetical protein